MVLKLCLLAYLISAAFIVNVACEGTTAASNKVSSAGPTSKNSSASIVAAAGTPKGEILPTLSEATTIAITTEEVTTPAPTEPPETTTEEEPTSPEPTEETTEENANDSETTAEDDETTADEEQTEESEPTPRVPTDTTEVDSEPTDDFPEEGELGGSESSSPGKHKSTAKPRHHKSAAGTVVCPRALITSFVVISLYMSALI